MEGLPCSNILLNLADGKKCASRPCHVAFFFSSLFRTMTLAAPVVRRACWCSLLGGAPASAPDCRLPRPPRKAKVLDMWCSVIYPGRELSASGRLSISPPLRRTFFRCRSRAIYIHRLPQYIVDFYVELRLERKEQSLLPVPTRGLAL